MINVQENREKMKPELGFILKLKKIIDEYYQAKDVSIKMVMLKEFSNDLQSILDLYGNLTGKIGFKRKNPMYME